MTDSHDSFVTLEEPNYTMYCKLPVRQIKLKIFLPDSHDSFEAYLPGEVTPQCSKRERE